MRPVKYVYATATLAFAFVPPHVARLLVGAVLAIAAGILLWAAQDPSVVLGVTEQVVRPENVQATLVAITQPLADPPALKIADAVLAGRTVAPPDLLIAFGDMVAIDNPTLRPDEVFEVILERVAAGELMRVIITLPPRHLKSQVASVAFPAWLFGRDPTDKIVCASYSSGLAEDFGRQTRNLMQAPFYRATFPLTQIDPKKSAVHEFHTLKKGRRIATSVGGTLTGKGGSTLIIDDPMKAEDALSLVKRDNAHGWFNNTAASRLNNPKTGAIVIVAQRLHVDDLIGRLTATGNWEVFSWPAIATEPQILDLADGVIWERDIGELLHPERMGMEELDRVRCELGSAAFVAQYQQSPVLPGGNLVKREWFKTYDGPPRPSQYEAVVQSWDTASVPGIDNDYSVCTTWGLINDHVDLLDVHRAQYHYPDLQRAARKLRQKWKPRLIVVERPGSGSRWGMYYIGMAFRTLRLSP